MRENYDFTGSVRGKYARRYAQGTNLVLLEPDVAKAFPNASSVNDSLRAQNRAHHLPVIVWQNGKVVEQPA